VSRPGRFGGGTTGGWTIPFTGSIYGSICGGATSPPSGFAFEVSYNLIVKLNQSVISFNCIIHVLYTSKVKYMFLVLLFSF